MVGLVGEVVFGPDVKKEEMTLDGMACLNTMDPVKTQAHSLKAIAGRDEYAGHIIEL
jgi:hypothetical protein